MKLFRFLLVCVQTKDGLNWIGTVYRRYTDFIPGRQNLKHIEIIFHGYPISDRGRIPDRERYFDDHPAIPHHDVMSLVIALQILIN